MKSNKDPENLQQAASEVYQAVGVLLSDTGRFTDDDGQHLLDLLSWMAGNRDNRPEGELLPFDSQEKPR